MKINSVSVTKDVIHFSFLFCHRFNYFSVEAKENYELFFKSFVELSCKAVEKSLCFPALIGGNANLCIFN